MLLLLCNLNTASAKSSRETSFALIASTSAGNVSHNAFISLGAQIISNICDAVTIDYYWGKNGEGSSP